ncbi:MAG: hypothetical protein QGG36_00805 [Pirellulaceae bacterium]|nr:hypothetical protein [Pirellulaceae bacterium]
MPTASRNCVTGLLIMAALLMAAEHCNGQGRRDRQVVYFRLSLDGVLQPRTRVVAGDVRAIEQAVFLTSPDVRRELDVLPEQSDEITKLLETYRENVQRIRKTEFADKSTTAQQVDDKIRRLNQQVTGKLDYFLLPHQTDRLDELRYRCELRRTGLSRSLLTGSLKQELIVTETQAAQIRQARIRLVPELSKKSLQLRRDAIEKLLSVLSDGQRKQLKTLLGSLYQSRHGNLEILIWQLGYKPDATTVHDPYDGLRAQAGFEVSVSGTLQPMYRPSGLLKRPPAETAVQFLHEPSFMEFMGVDAVQEELLDDLVKFRKRGLQALDARAAKARRESATDPQRWNQFRREFVDDQRALWRELDELFFELLTDEQEKRLLAFSAGLDVVRRGHVAALHGTVGKEINVGAKQLETIVAKAHDVRSELIEETTQMHGRVYEELLRPLSAKQRAEFKRRAGEPLQRTHGNVTLLLLDLTRRE